LGKAGTFSPVVESFDLPSTDIVLGPMSFISLESCAIYQKISSLQMPAMFMATNKKGRRNDCNYRIGIESR
jgi:hypothetical protein